MTTLFFFFFNDTATTEIYTLSLHDALPISPGAVFGVVLWLVLSIGFAFYVRNFGSYGAAYGAFGTAILLLLWLYLSANAFLLGAELNAELERTAQARSRSVSSVG